MKKSIKINYLKLIMGPIARLGLLALVVATAWGAQADSAVGTFDYELKAELTLYVSEHYPELFDPAAGIYNNPDNQLAILTPHVKVGEHEYPVRMESAENLCAAFGKKPGELTYSTREVLRASCTGSPECQKTHVNARVLPNGSVDLEPRDGTDDIGILFCE